jgi:hypothetical protein
MVNADLAVVLLELLIQKTLHLMLRMTTSVIEYTGHTPTVVNRPRTVSVSRNGPSALILRCTHASIWCLSYLIADDGLNFLKRSGTRVAQGSHGVDARLGTSRVIGDHAIRFPATSQLNLRTRCSVLGQVIG